MTVSYAQIRESTPQIFEPGCSTRVILDHVMSKWGVLVLSSLSDGTRRWGELRALLLAFGLLRRYLKRPL